MSRIRKHFMSLPQFDSTLSKAGLLGIYVFCLPVFIIIGLGMPTGLGLYIDLPMMSLLGLLAILIANLFISTLLGFIRINFPRLLLGGFITAFLFSSIALQQSNISYWGTALISFILISMGFIVSTSLLMMVKSIFTRSHQYVYIGLCFILITMSLMWLNGNLPMRTSDDHLLLSEHIVSTIDAKNPGEIGTYAYEYLTYGSGVDRHRAEFGDDVDMVTRTVDGSELIDHWSPIRKLFWGHDQTDLPLNGRVWMPQGDGPFPVVLIVHGNHLMEYFSDEGYAYLGQLLASRGFIAVSVDENFINYSVWSGGLSNDMELRSWTILQHIEEIRELNRLTNTPLSSKVDMNRIALIGHSRGGQAIVRAAENPLIHNDVKAVIAIAPTDMKVDKQYLNLNHINYMVIHGSQDADVSTFTGDRQYERASLTSRSYGFKTSLYVAGANHGQFNTDWGIMDLSLPTGLFLNQQDILDGEDQRRIAKTYISAFLETSFMNTNTYLPMFKDYRQALDWLPKTSYRNRFEASDMVRISNFDEDHNSVTTSIPRGTIHADNLDVAEEILLKDRQDSSRQNRSVKLSWSNRTGSYELIIPEHVMMNKLNADSVFTFSIANVLNQSNLDFTIELESEDGVIIRSPFSKFNSILPAIHTRFTKERFLDVAVREGRYGASSEPILQTYMIPLKELINYNETYPFNTIKTVRFLFNQQPKGSILLDDIGIYLTK